MKYSNNPLNDKNSPFSFKAFFTLLEGEVHKRSVELSSNETTILHPMWICSLKNVNK